jgi:sugar phosphate isomerase/epimerase
VDFRNALGIQSYCFRKFQPMGRLIEVLREAGLSNVELWPGHLPFDQGPAAADQPLAQLQAAGISVSSYGAIDMGKDPAGDRQAMEMARHLGIEAVTVMFGPEHVDHVQALADEYDLKLAMHNHGPKHPFATVADMKDLVGKTNERIGVCLDTAWVMAAKDDPVEAIRALGDRLYGVHLKDMVFDAEGNGTDKIIGEGGLDLPGVLAAMKDIRFDGYLSIEYEGNADDPVDEVKACIKKVTEALA